MNWPLHSRDETAVHRMSGSEWKYYQEGESCSVGRKSIDVCFFFVFLRGGLFRKAKLLADNGMQRRWTNCMSLVRQNVRIKEKAKAKKIFIKTSTRSHFVNCCHKATIRSCNRTALRIAATLHRSHQIYPPVNIYNWRNSALGKDSSQIWMSSLRTNPHVFYFITIIKVVNTGVLNDIVRHVTDQTCD